MLTKLTVGGFPWCPGVKTLCFQCRRLGLDPWLGELSSHIPLSMAKGEKELTVVIIPQYAHMPIIMLYT